MKIATMGKDKMRRRKGRNGKITAEKRQQRRVARKARETEMEGMRAIGKDGGNKIGRLHLDYELSNQAYSTY